MKRRDFLLGTSAAAIGGSAYFAWRKHLFSFLGNSRELFAICDEPVVDRKKSDYERPGTVRIFSLDGAVNAFFHLPLKGHVAAQNPKRPEQLAMIPKWGPLGAVINWRESGTPAILNAGEDRDFYGHLIYSPDGSELFTSEMDKNGISA